MKDKIIYLEWDDHWTCSTPWLSSKDLAEEKGGHYSLTDYKPATCKSIGWLVHEDKKAYYLSAMKGEEQWKGEMCILKSAVTKKKLIKL